MFPAVQLSNCLLVPAKEMVHALPVARPPRLVQTVLESPATLHFS